jgi:hypothetical protein
LMLRKRARCCSLECAVTRPVGTNKCLIERCRAPITRPCPTQLLGPGLLAGWRQQLVGGGLGAICAQGRGFRRRCQTADCRMGGKLNGGSMILSSAWTCVIWASRFGTRATKGLSVRTNGTSNWLSVRSSTLGRMLSHSRERSASPVSRPIPY